MVTLGTDAGFVSSTPSSDPGGTSIVVDNNRIATKDVSPVSINTITEIGVYFIEATEASNFEVGIYTDEGNGEPETLIGVSRINAKGTTSGWKTVTGLNIPISPETTYWIALQLDNTASTTRLRYSSGGGAGIAALFGGSSTTLPTDWGTSDWKNANGVGAIYAIAENITAGFTRLIKVSGTFVDKPIKIKVGGTFVDKPIKIKVGGTFQDA